jgi:gamma-glutamyl-gamma-aminobutyrate hydrolase PuuD
VAWAGDGVIEGIENREASSYIIGIQSHPESLVEQAEKTWLKLFSSFVKAAEKW